MLINDLLHVIAIYAACLLIYVGVYSDEWKVYKHFKGAISIDARAGLFKSCIKDLCIDHDQDETVKVLVVLGLIVALLCAVTVTLFFMCNRICETYVTKIPLLIFTISIFGGGLVIIGCGIFAYRYLGNNIYPGYSFVITLIGGIILPIGGSTESKT